MNTKEPFRIETRITQLAVAVREGAVGQVQFSAGAKRLPGTSFEQRIAQELQEYFTGRLIHFTVPVAPEGTDFEKRVWQAIGDIPYGETATYGEIARVIGSPGAARAVGLAAGRNPVPILIPCHRVVAAGGRLGGFGGGVELKRRLLALEARNRRAPAAAHELELFSHPTCSE
jgi:methylated-DNA-[protein]-cysteine S-methyltransferase